MARDQSTYSRWRWQQSYGNSLQHRVITARNQSPHHADAGNVRQRHSGLAIVSSDVCGVTRVYAQWIFRPRKLRLAELIVGLQGFYFIPGPPNPTVASANRYFGDHFRVHLLITRKKERRRDRFQTRTNGRSASRNNSHQQIQWLLQAECLKDSAAHEYAVQ